MSETRYQDRKTPFEPPRSLATQVAKELGQLIITQHYPVGSLLEDETALAASHDVSRSVIRDAVKILVGKGLLEVRRGIGTRVKPKNKWGLLDHDVLSWRQSGNPDPDTLRQLMEMRCIFEPQAARLAAQYATPSSIAAIGEAITDMENEANSLNGFIEADAAFHKAVLLATENEFLMALEGVVFSALLGSLRITNHTVSANSGIVDNHRVVYGAIVERDANAAEKGMQRLLEDARIKLGGRMFRA